MAEETTTTTTEASDAERARAAADAATASAANAAALAQVEAANVQQQAADRVAAIEGEASSWRGLREQFEERTAESNLHREQTESRLTAMGEQLSSILSRLAPPPAPPTSPASDPAAAASLTPPPAAAPPAPEPPRPAAAKRAHRWI